MKRNKPITYEVDQKVSIQDMGREIWRGWITRLTKTQAVVAHDDDVTGERATARFRLSDRGFYAHGIGPGAYSRERLLVPLKGKHKRPKAKVRGDGKVDLVPADDLKEILNALAGAYDHWGIVSWFQRPREQLGGRTPLQAIDDGDVAKVKSLALSLGGMQAT